MIYICIPTHNEQQTVGVVLWKLRQVLTDFPREYQLLVVDDASTDKTPEVLEPYTRVLPLTVVRSDRRLGHGASLELLLREAVRRSEYPKRDVVVTLQADFSDEPDDLVPLIKRLEAGADVAVGNKVAKSKPSRMRRFSLALAGFFARGQKWPDGVETPFDGFRAYRVHAVKRAIDSREGRLIRHDGWAAHAELLRQVLPHARRVDALAVVDRTDRLQRARRERPFAAALEVRAMSRGAAPAGLVTVTELDNIVATASRSRDRARIAQPGRNGRSDAARGNGAPARGRDREEPSGSRTRQTGGVRPMRGGRAQDATADEPAGRQRKPRAKTASRRGQGGSAKTADKPDGTAAAPAPAVAHTPAATAGPAAVTAADGRVAGTAPSETAAEQPAAPKKKRRRRRRSGSSATTAQAADASTTETPTAAGAAAPAGSAAVRARADNGPERESGGSTEAGAEDNAAGDATGARRRRRGGRRGGRGRRRTSRPEGAPESAEPGAADAAAPERAPDAAAPADRSPGHAPAPEQRDAVE